MRHKKLDQKFGRSKSHREALLASLVCNLIVSRRITTTLSKAKAARSLAEKMVTLGRKGTLAARRSAISVLHRPERVAELFEKIAPEFSGRPGGYTRILKVGDRTSDGSKMAILEWVDVVSTAGSDVGSPAADSTSPKKG